jgi:DNA-nicking Smr family endonuclease
MKQDQSIYRLLSGLPGIAEEKPAVRAAPEKRVEPDDTTLFQEEMKNVKVMERAKNRVIRKADNSRRTVHSAYDVREQLKEAIEDGRAFCVPNLPEYMEGHTEDINPLVMDRLRNGEFSIQKVLDLHGYAVPDAYTLFRDFIREAVGEGLHCVKIIHGRGLKSKAGPVLKEKLKEWIVRAMHRKWVVAFSSSKMCEGGPGATVILLRLNPKKKRIHIAG